MKFSFKKTNRGFVGIILLVLIALAAIGGGAYVYTNNVSKEEVVVQNTPIENSDQVETKEEPNQTTSASKSPVVETKVNTSIKTSVNTETKPITTSSPSSTCGSVLDSHFAFESDKRTTLETNSLGCLSRAILDCSAASLDVTGGDKGRIQVYSKSGQNCVIGSTIGGNKKCDVPLSLISDLEDYSIKEKEPIEDLVIPITLIMAFGSANDMRAGETIKVNCQSY